MRERSFKEKADGSQMVEPSTAVFKVRNGPCKDQKTDTTHNTCTHTKITWNGQVDKSQSLSPHLLLANATGLQAEFTCQSHTSTRTHIHSHTLTFHVLRVTKV